MSGDAFLPGRILAYWLCVHVYTARVVLVLSQYLIFSACLFSIAFCSAVLFEKDKSVIQLLHELAPVEEV